MFTHERMGVDTADPVLVARQVIMDRHRHVFGYELLHRSGADAATAARFRLPGTAAAPRRAAPAGSHPLQRQGKLSKSHSSRHVVADHD